MALTTDVGGPDAPARAPGSDGSGTESGSSVLGWAARLFAWRWTTPLLAAAGTLSWAVGVGSIHPYTAGAVGLLTLLPPLWWLGLLLVTLSVVSELTRPAPRRVAIVTALVAFTLVLHGTLPAAESVPRFNAAYTIAGFTDYVARTGRTLPNLDARMSWPGLFAGAGLASEAMRVQALWFLRWSPLVFNLAYLLPLKAIANATLRSQRARWAALAVFLAGNWIDQDYFSPQAVNLLIFLAVVAIAIRTFGSRGTQPWPVSAVKAWRPVVAVQRTLVRAARLPFDVVPGEAAELSTAGTRAALVAVAVVLVGASVVSHQITPVSLTLILFALALVGRTRLKALWLLTGVMVFAYLSWNARAYWAGHLNKIFGGVGSITTTLNSSVGARLTASSLGRVLVGRGRIVDALVIWLAAALGFWLLYRRGRTYWTIGVLAVAPVLVAGVVSYGGEVVLRILLFSLAPCAVLIAGMLDAERLRRVPVVACLVVGALLLAIFPLVRFGNESFEAFAPGDFAAAVWIHEHVPANSRILIANRDEPLYYTHVGVYKLQQLGAIVFAPENQLRNTLPYKHRDTFVYLTRSEYLDGVDHVGEPSGWLSAFLGRLLQSRTVTVVYRSSTAYVLHVVPKPPHKRHVVIHRPRAPRPVFPKHPRKAPVHRIRPPHVPRSQRPAPVAPRGLHPEHVVVPPKPRVVTPVAPRTPRAPRAPGTTTTTTTTTTTVPVPPPTTPPPLGGGGTPTPTSVPPLGGPTGTTTPTPTTAPPFG